ncbi:MAG: hypothetical protein AAFP10_08465 [Pseudomonadota bacterium]
MKYTPMLCLLISLAGCATQPSATVATDLYARLPHYQGIEHYRACVLLGELELTERQLQTLQIRTAKDPEADLCDHYLPARQQLGPQAMQNFLTSIPTGRAQIALWQLHAEAGFPVSFTPPYITLLNRYASNHPRALDILISAIPYADASIAQQLIDLLANHYRYRPTQVQNQLQTWNIAADTIHLIRQNAEHTGHQP